MDVIDLRSDILVRPTQAMTEAMAASARRHRSYGIRECPDQRRLEAYVAALLGKADALFFPTCTMANQAALMLHCRPGEAVLADVRSHIAGTEASATAGIAGVKVRGIAGTHGHLPPDIVDAALRGQPGEAMRRIRLVWMENTHNNAGGTVQPEAWLRNIAAICAQRSVPIHMDGARLWNAAIALDASPAKLVEGVTSVAVSLNKALGAPLGALFVSDAASVASALEIRQMLGGGWRRSGIVAAAGLVAVETMRARVVEDHRRARCLALAIADQTGPLTVDLASVQTNIVNVGTPAATFPAPRLVGALAESGVLVTAHGDDEIRLVLHAEIDDVQVDATIAAFAAVGRIATSG